MKTGKFIIFILLLTLSATAMPQSSPVQEPMIFDTPEQEARFQHLTMELRCTVCQNQNLADSDAQLAHDLRAQVHEMLLAGKTDQEIKDYMVQRYGDFVLYRPPVQKNTYLLWVAPMLLLLVGALVLRSSVKKRAALLDEAGSNDQ